MLRFQRGMRQLAQVIEAGTHIKLIAMCVKQSDIHRHAERMNRAARRIGQILPQRRVFQMLPQQFLYAMRPQRVQHQQCVFGLLVLHAQASHDALQACGGVAMQPLAIQIAVQVTANKIVGAGIAQVDRDAVDGRERTEVRMPGNQFTTHRLRFQMKTFRINSLWAADCKCMKMPELPFSPILYRTAGKLTACTLQVKLFMFRFIILAALSCATFISNAQQALPASVANALREAGLPEQSLGAVVLPISGGAPRLAFGAEQPLAPASTMKIVTTLIALEQLGPAFEWRTQLLTEGSIKADVLQGDVYLRGGGDPNLTIEKLQGMLRALMAQGVRTIKGNLVLDRSYFQPSRPDVGVPDFDEFPRAYYNVIPDALLLNSNLLELTLQSSLDQVAISTYPPMERVQVEAAMTLTDEDCKSWNDDRTQPPDVRKSFTGKAVLTLHGTFPRNCRAQTATNILDRNLYIERAIRALWRELGGRWSGTARDGTTPAGARLLVERKSETLADIVRPVNKRSDNAMARTLYLTLGAERAKKNGAANTLTAADAVVRDWFARQAIATDGLVIENGSGLSRLERISPQQLAAVLQAGARSNWFAEFASSLPIATVDGTMRKRLTGLPALAQARIKTGGLRDVAAIAGYVRDTGSQHWIVVGIINDANSKKGRPVLDALISWVAGAGSNSDSSGSSNEVSNSPSENGQIR